jgi:hypothetical protein
MGVELIATIIGSGTICIVRGYGSQSSENDGSGQYIDTVDKHVELYQASRRLWSVVFGLFVLRSALKGCRRHGLKSEIWIGNHVDRGIVLVVQYKDQ